jgi:hypothetical protein
VAKWYAFADWVVEEVLYEQHDWLTELDFSSVCGDGFVGRKFDCVSVI